MGKLRRFGIMASLVAALTFTIAACGSDDEGSGGGGMDPTPVATTRPP